MRKDFLLLAAVLLILFGQAKLSTVAACPNAQAGCDYDEFFIKKSAWQGWQSFRDTKLQYRIGAARYGGVYVQFLNGNTTKVSLKILIRTSKGVVTATAAWERANVITLPYRLKTRASKSWM